MFTLQSLTILTGKKFYISSAFFFSGMLRKILVNAPPLFKLRQLKMAAYAGIIMSPPGLAKMVEEEEEK